MTEVIIIGLAVLSCIGQAAAILLLLGQRRGARAVLSQDSRHVIDGGNAFAEAQGPNASTAFDDLTHTLSASTWVLAALAVGLLCGLAATVLGVVGAQ